MTATLTRAPDTTVETYKGMPVRRWADLSDPEKENLTYDNQFYNDYEAEEIRDTVAYHFEELGIHVDARNIYWALHQQGYGVWIDKVTFDVSDVTDAEFQKTVLPMFGRHSFNHKTEAGTTVPVLAPIANATVTLSVDHHNRQHIDIGFVFTHDWDDWEYAVAECAEEGPIAEAIRDFIEGHLGKCYELASDISLDPCTAEGCFDYYRFDEDGVSVCTEDDLD